MDALTRLRALPPGSLVPVEWVVSELEQGRATTPVEGPALVREDRAEPSWREKLWTAPAETRLGVAEVVEATGKPRSWVYKGTSAGTLPHRKFEGALVFTCGEIRAYLRDHEQSVTEGRMESAASERGLLRAS